MMMSKSTASQLKPEKKPLGSSENWRRIVVICMKALENCIARTMKISLSQFDTLVEVRRMR